jgi:hypothetical protein
MRRHLSRLAALAVVFAAFVPRAAAQTPYPKQIFRYQFLMRSFELAGRLSQRVDFDGYDDPKITLLDALKSLGRRYHIVFDLNERAFKEAGHTDISDLLARPVAPTPLPAMKDVPLSAVLRAVLGRFPTGAETTFVIRQDALEITTRRGAALDAWDGVHVLVWEYRARLACARPGDVRLYTVDAARLLGEVAYWLGVMRDNVRPLALGGKARPADR